jgi:hypothetical protein
MVHVSLVMKFHEVSVLTGGVVLALVLGGLGCARPAADGGQVKLGAGGPCESRGNQAASEVLRKLARFKGEERADEAERLSIELGSAFELRPCDLVFGAIAEGYSDGQIASLIGAMPLEFVDLPCKSKERLIARVELLMAVPGLDRASSIAGYLQGALGRDSRECLRQQRE